MFLAIIFLIILAVWFYVLWGRDIIRTKLTGTSLDKYMKIADTFWMQSRTVLVGRAYWLIGILLGLHETAALAGFDFTPFYHEVANLFPETLRPFIPALIMYATGIMIVKLRKMTMEETEPKKDPE